MKIGRRIMSLVVSSSSVSPSLSHYSEWLVGEKLHSLLLIKKPRVPLDEFIRLSSPPLRLSILPPALHPLIPSPFFPPPPHSVWTPTSFLSLSLFIPPSSICLFFPPSCRVKQQATGLGRRKEKMHHPRQGGNQTAWERKRKSPLWQMTLF